MITPTNTHLKSIVQASAKMNDNRCLFNTKKKKEIKKKERKKNRAKYDTLALVSIMQAFMT